MHKLNWQLKHLAGQHEQKSHAGKGRGSVKPGIDKSSDAYKSSTRLMRDAESCCRSNPYKPNDEVIDKIAKRSGVSSSTTEEFFISWNSGAKEIPTVHKAISEEMNVKMSDHQIKRYASAKIDPAKLDDYKKITRSIYDETQEELAKRGMTEVSLYRGAIFPEGHIEESFKVDYKMNSAESWTSAKGVADNFVELRLFDDEDVGMIMSATIPVSRILSTPLTGAGTTSESEYVVLGGNDSDIVETDEYFK